MPSLVPNTLMTIQNTQSLSSLTHSNPSSHSSLPQSSFSHSSKSPSPTVVQMKPRHEREEKSVRSSTEGKSTPDKYLNNDREVRNEQSSPLSLSQPATSLDHSQLKRRHHSHESNWEPTSNSESSEPPGPPISPLQLTPVLDETQIQKIADTAAELVKSLPDLEPKQPNVKKKICKELEMIITMPDEDSRKMDEIRKFSAIYGRFDCKRNPEKPLTLHEVSVNEAAAQICHLVPAMLTRREELFPLARQVVRDSGYQYSKGHSRSTFSLSNKLFNGDEGPFKRMRFSEDSEMTQRRRERMEQILDEARLITDRVEELRTAGGTL